MELFIKLDCKNADELFESIKWMVEGQYYSIERIGAQPAQTNNKQSTPCSYFATEKCSHTSNCAGKDGCGFSE